MWVRGEFAADCGTKHFINSDATTNRRLSVYACSYGGRFELEVDYDHLWQPRGALGDVRPAVPDRVRAAAWRRIDLQRLQKDFEYLRVPQGFPASAANRAVVQPRRVLPSRFKWDRAYDGAAGVSGFRLELGGAWWQACGAIALALFPLMIVLRVTRRRIKPDHCVRCGYDLRGSPERCPECGTVATAIPRELSAASDI